MCMYCDIAKRNEPKINALRVQIATLKQQLIELDQSMDTSGLDEQDTIKFLELNTEIGVLEDKIDALEEEGRTPDDWFDDAYEENKDLLDEHPLEHTINPLPFEKDYKEGKYDYLIEED